MRLILPHRATVTKEPGSPVVGPGSPGASLARHANDSAAKAGVQDLSRTLALALGKFGVNVNAIAPGFIATDMTEDTARRVGVSVEDFRAAAGLGSPVHVRPAAASAARSPRSSGR
jgi:NAD(P)-dependent dehydrogenase (short-subunit alcohol dehydrogenase family)